MVDPGYGIDREILHFIYNKNAKSSNSIWAMFQVFNNTSWIIIGLSGFVMALIAFVFGKDRNFQTLLWSFCTIGKAFCGQSFDIDILKQKQIGSKYLLIFSISLIGVFIYWYFTGLLISFLTVPSQETPLRILDDLLTKTDFRILVKESWASTSFIQKWAKNDSRKFETYQKFVAAHFIDSQLKMSSTEVAKMISEDPDPNQVMLYPGSVFDQLGKTNFRIIPKDQS